MKLEKALQIELGTGKVKISHFTDSDGRGLLFEDTGTPHEVGASTGEPSDEQHMPKPGEVYIKCSSLAAANVLREMAEEMCQRFEG